MVGMARRVWEYADTPRSVDLRRRVRAAMEVQPVAGLCPPRIAERHMGEPLPVRKALALALKLASLPVDLWDGQLFAGSHALEWPRAHYEWGKVDRGVGSSFPDYATPAERARAAARGLSIESVFGHIVPDYPRLLALGLSGILAEAEAQRPVARTAEEHAFLDSVRIALEGVMAYAARLAAHCDSEAAVCPDPARAVELAQMAANLRQVPTGPAQSFWQALQSVWLLHMIFHATRNGNAMGRVPLIPGITDTEENLRGIFCTMREAGLREVALLPYNPAAGAKYEWLDLTHEVRGEPQGAAQLAALLALACDIGVEAVVG